MSRKQIDEKSGLLPRKSSRDTREYITPADLTPDEVKALEETVYSPDKENLDHLYE